MSQIPKVSVLIPVYNSAPYIKEAVYSILNQTFTDFEILLFNDGSKDASGDILKSIDDHRIRLFDDGQNTGYVKRLNDGLKLARGQYIARMDSDDIAMPERFAKQVALLDEHPAIGLCGTSFLAFGSHEFVANMPVTDREIREAMLIHNPIGHPTVMMRKSVIDKYDLEYEPGAMPVEDYRMWYEFSKVTQLHNIPEILLKYRRHTEQISVVLNEKQRIKVDEIRLIQLLDKGFELSNDEKILYCAILNESVLLRSSNDFKSITLLIAKILEQNSHLKAYDNNTFKNAFSKNLRALINRIEKYSPGYIPPVLFYLDFFCGSLTYSDRIKFFMKSILFWKPKVVKV